MKAGLQALLACVPCGEALNHRLQIWNGFYDNFRWHIQGHVAHLCNLLRTTSRHGFSPAGAKVLEVGTGWIPTVPVAMHVLGAQIHTYDHVRHVRIANLCQVIDLCRDWFPNLAKAAECEIAQMEARLVEFRRGRRDSLEEWLRAFDIYYHAPGDAARSGISSESLDLYFSIAVFEHVPIDAIKAMLREAYRTLRPGGLTYHLIGLFDHYTTMDPTITRVNFLKYSDLTWRIIGQNKIQFHNRLRASEFIRLFEEARFEIVEQQSEVDERSLKALGSMRLSPKFRQFEPSDLATYTTTICARKPRSTQLRASSNGA